MTKSLSSMAILGRRLGVSAHVLAGLWATTWFPLHSPAKRLAITKAWEKKLCEHLALEIITTGELYPKAAILIANHISWLDIPVLHSRFTDFFLTKTDVVRWPLLGALVARTGNIPFQRGAGQWQMAMAGLRAYLAAGHKILLFPEGTTTDGNQIGRFFSPMLAALLDARWPVQAITLAYPWQGRSHPEVGYYGDITFAESFKKITALPKITVTCDLAEPIFYDGQAAKTLLRDLQQTMTTTLAARLHASAISLPLSVSG
jgi:1-acyl-sn-glycerol-3-phosphate acyltransferase